MGIGEAGAGSMLAEADISPPRDCIRNGLANFAGMCYHVRIEQEAFI